MRVMSTSLATVMFALGVAGCGGGALDPGAGDDPGAGSKTLAVEGWVRATARAANARDADAFDTELSVRVSLNSQTVTSGSVTVTTADGKLGLVYGSGNRWGGTASGYAEVYVLDVISGADRATGIRVDGPAIHVFSQPAEGASVDATQPLAVAWQHADAADSAALRTDNGSPLTIADTGSYTLAPGALKADHDAPRAQTLRLARTNRIAPAGAAAGSTWSVTVENQLDVVAQPLP